jgi:RNA polymerase sigma factor (sigma-70 family)
MQQRLTRDNDEDGKARFSEVVLPHLSDAMALAVWLTGNRADAEDIVQEACIRAFRAIARYGGGSARAWVLSIVRNTAYTWLKKHRGAPTVSIDDLAPDERARLERDAQMHDFQSPSPEEELIRRADAAQLTAAINLLPVEFRETLILRDVQGLDYREIAEVTSVPLGTVMSRLARARRRLIGLLKAD